MSVRTTLNCQLKNSNQTALKSFLAENLSNVRDFEGCLSVKVFFNTNGNEMLLEEEWINIKHHKNYLKFIEENGVLGELAKFLECPPDIKLSLIHISEPTRPY